MGCSKHLYDAQFVPFCQALYTSRRFHFLSWQRDGLQVSRHLQFTIFWHLSLSSLYQIYCVWPFHQSSHSIDFPLRYVGTVIHCNLPHIFFKVSNKFFFRQCHVLSFYNAFTTSSNMHYCWFIFCLAYSVFQ